MAFPTTLFLSQECVQCVQMSELTLHHQPSCDDAAAPLLRTHSFSRAARGRFQSSKPSLRETCQTTTNPGHCRQKHVRRLCRAKSGLAVGTSAGNPARHIVFLQLQPRIYAYSTSHGSYLDVVFMCVYLCVYMCVLVMDQV